MFPRWARISLDSRQYLHSLQIDGGPQYRLLVTDMAQLMVEEVSSEHFKKRFIELNSDLEDVDMADGINEISEVLEDLTKCDKVAVEHGENSMKISLDWFSGGIPFSWEFLLQRSSGEMFESIVTKGLTSVISVLLQERDILFNIVRDKDLELEDYVNSGAKLTRKSLKTDRFDRVEFLSKPVDGGGRDGDSVMDVMVGPGVANILAKYGQSTAAETVDGGSDKPSQPKSPAEVKNGTRLESPGKILKRSNVVKPSFKAPDDDKRKKTKRLNKL